jgi:hypothetical protein
MQAREGNQIYCKLSKIGVQLAGKAKAASDTTHRCTNKMIQITNWNTLHKPQLGKPKAKCTDSRKAEKPH